MTLILKNPWPWIATSSCRLVISGLPSVRSICVLLIFVPRPTWMPEGETSEVASVAPGWRSVTYIRSSKLHRLPLNAVVSAFARLFETTSIRVDSARSPVAAELSAAMAMLVTYRTGPDRGMNRGCDSQPSFRRDAQRSAFCVHERNATDSICLVQDALR